MVDDDHSACVDAWMQRGGAELTSDRLVQAFEQAFAAVWRRAHQTLGDITLTAIVDRVLYVAAEKHVAFSALEVDTGVLRVASLRAAALARDELSGGVRFVLVELLRVLGTLTAEILTPALHAEISKLAPGVPSGPETSPRATTDQDPSS